MYSPENEQDERSRIVSTETVLPWVRESQRGESEELLAKASPVIHHLARHLKLNDNQVQILHAGLLLAPSWLSAIAQKDEAYLADIRGTADLRAVVPCLTTLGERYDAHGNLLPILGRSLVALMAHFGALEGDLSTDSGKYDPEIAAMVAGFDQAA